MTRNRPVYAQPIGFLRRAPAPTPATPFQGPPSFPQMQMMRPPFAPNQPFFPNPGGAFPPTTPPVAPPSSPGIGNVLQNLLSGQGSLDINSMMTNAQKMIGVVNQLGTAVRNMSPMIEMLKGLSDPDPLDDIEEGSTSSRRKRVKRTRRSRRKLRVSRKRGKKRR